MRAGFVSIVGRPNAGKSTLLNRILGAKVAIVSDKPQTTRTRILGVKTYGDGQAVFIDTPGIHKPMHTMNARMVDAAVQATRDVDVVLLVVDASLPTGPGDTFVIGVVQRASRPALLALNKIDLIDKPALLPLIDWYRRQHAFEEIVPISAATGDGVGHLEQVLLSHLPEGEAVYPDDYLTDQPERTLAAEIVREKLLHHTRDELPYTTAVIVDRFEEPDARGLMRLFCTILVEHESQKPIVIGRQGAMIKRIGTEAREELERFFETRVFLDLHVKVRTDWREDERVLGELGLGKRRR
jgi:GTP-binding protein Era